MREPISKKLRFEVFKRDSFTCQYCGAKAPDAVLHCDHIHPVAEGGKSEILNLVTACEGCNLGKGARMLDDRSVVERQVSQLAEIQERREQLEMLLEWRDALQREQLDVIEELGRRIYQKTKLGPNENGDRNLKRWVKNYGLAHVLHAVDIAFDSYLEWAGDEPTNRSWEMAFKKIGSIASLQKQAEDKPQMPKLAYINGILKRRFNTPRENYIPELEDIFGWGVPLEVMEYEAKIADGGMLRYWDTMVACAKMLGCNGQN